jgi:predicted flap endonuclease-1-like 5' DNA nuclease
LTAIRGIGIATQNRLYRAGIKSYGQLARATPEDVREILGKSAGGASVEKWIAEAKQLSNERKS